MSTQSRRFRFKTLFAALLLMMLAGVAGSVPGYASKTDLMSIAEARTDKDPTIAIYVGTGKVVDVNGDIADIMVADPGIVEVSALNSKQLYMVGRTLGATNIIALDEKGTVVKRMNIHVTVNIEHLNEAISELYPKEDVTIKLLQQRMIITGEVSTPEIASGIQNLVGHFLAEITGDDIPSMDSRIFNMLTVRGKSQVMLQVKILEVKRSLLREKRTDTQISDWGGIFGESIGVSSALGGLAGLMNSTSPTGAPDIGLFGVRADTGAFGPIDTVLHALEQEGLAKVLAEPNLSTVSGGQADFLAGGIIQIPTPPTSTGQVGVSPQSFGVSLAFQPVVMSDDRIILTLSTEVSSINRTNAVQGVPGLDVRRANTTVELASGSSLVIAGLLQSSTLDEADGIPGLNQIPILRELMASDSFRRDESEMVVLVTPYVVEPFAEKRAEKVVKERTDSNALATAFEKNIRRTYGSLKLPELFKEETVYGYIID